MTETSSGTESADDFVSGLEIPVRPPAVRRRPVVLVTGPWLAGSTSVAEALRVRLPDTEFVETDDLHPGEVPEAVVFVVSATAKIAESDCALLDAAAANTDVVVPVVSKIDAHRTWRDTLAADRDILADYRPRYADAPWVGVAAAPDLGDPQLDELVEVLVPRLASNSLEERNQLRAWEFRIESTIRDYRNGAVGVGRQAAAAQLRERRAELVRRGRMTRTERSAELRNRTQQARAQLTYFARNRCASLRTELAEDAAGLTRAGTAGFPDLVEERITTVVGEVDDGIDEHLADIAATADLPADESPVRTDAPPLPAPPPRRSLETRLMMLLGAGFGLGVALTLSRLVAGFAPGFTVAASVLCVAVGVALTLWVVSTRSLLGQRAALDRWAGEAVGALQATCEQAVATRVATAERDWTTALIEQSESLDGRISAEVRAVEAELREHAMTGARAIAARDKVVPELQQALNAVRGQIARAT